MADPILHIKDAYFFEVPKVLAPAAYRSRTEFPEVWVKLDPQFQDWEFDKLFNGLAALQVTLPPKDDAHHDWKHWQHEDHHNFAKPFDEFLEERYHQRRSEFEAWKEQQIAAARAAKNEGEVGVIEGRPIEDYLTTLEEEPYASFIQLRATPEFQARWWALRRETGSYDAVREYQADGSQPAWSTEKIDAYNFHLSGKILIQQPFGELRNLHEAETTLVNPTDKWMSEGFINRDNFGFAISKFMLIEVAVGLVVWIVFSWLASRVASGAAPRGTLWNLLEFFVAFIRDEIARPALDGHHGAEHGSEANGHGEHTHAGQGHPPHGHIGHGHGHERDEALGDPVGSVSASHAAVVHHDHEPPPSVKYTPVLCTIFFFILGMNLAGMLPWVGAPTGTWAVTLALAIVTLLVGFAGGVRQFGLAGYLLNQIPSMDLPTYMAVVLKPVIFVIELGGLVIKHGVLSVRLVANMLAGHMVLLAIMGLAFGATAAATFVLPDGDVSLMWWVAAIGSVVGCALLSLLELFVAFLQAYVFTLLSALFIGAAIHKH